ncbi:uncharacterized protein LOC143358149 [Halictus rubicundus]|uniref:uncharacterized protein LOC143358149 n=1 Tax=Halictus rubicundus TaxID=77578 RepID=UPI004035880A
MSSIPHFDTRRPLKIIYWNTKSFRARLRDALSEPIHADVDVFVGVETSLRPANVVVHPDNFVVIRQDRRDRKGGGIIVFIRKNLTFEERQIEYPVKDIEICSIRVKNVTPILDIIICYRPPETNTQQSEWDNIFKNIDTNICSIVLGDFNAHNRMWNCHSTSTHGKRLESVIFRNNLFLHNEDTLTYCDKSNIDMVFSTVNLADRVNVKVSNNRYGSDHNPIYVSVNFEKKYYYRKKSSNIPSKRIDWNTFRSRLLGHYKDFRKKKIEFFPQL